MVLTVMANNYRKSHTECQRACNDGARGGRRLGLSASGRGVMRASWVVVVEATGFGDTSWRRCVLSQVCRGEMKGWFLGSAQLGLNLLSAPFPSR